jgi:hypothetical protein
MALLESKGPVKFAKIDTAASADLVAAVTDKKIRVLSYVFAVAASVTVKFQTGAATDLTGAMTVTTSLSSGFNPAGHFETVAGAKLNVVLGGAVQVSGHLTYQEV